MNNKPKTVECPRCNGTGRMDISDEKYFLTYLGDKVRERRKELRMTQQLLGEQVGLTRTSINNIEAGRQNLVLTKLIKMADALDISVDELTPN